MQRINELLKPGGLFISVTPCLGEKTFLRIILFPLSKIGIIPYLKILKIPELEELVANGNFQIVETETFYHFSSDYFIVARKI